MMPVIPGIPAEFIEDLAHAGARVSAGAPLSGYTSFRLGGTSPLLVDCSNKESFTACWSGLLRLGIHPLLFGGGSNLLVSDRGVDRVVVRFVEAEPGITREGGLFRISAGTNLDDAARLTADGGFNGLVVCSGIPGTVGGAIAGNAGAFGEQIGERIVSINVLNRHGQPEVWPKQQLGFSYRKSNLPESGAVIVSALLNLDAGDVGTLQARRREILELRATKHPDWKRIPTAGSFFKNIEPTSRAERRQAAGWFLEQAGALKMKVGGARTFEKHANIIVAEPGCSSSDVVALSQMMADAVREKFGIILEREVKFIGNP